MTKVSEYTASVSYYKRDKETRATLKCDISFNWERIYIKSMILLNILENMRRTYLSQTDKEVQFLTFDNKLIDPKYGCFRMCKEVV